MEAVQIRPQMALQRLRGRRVRTDLLQTPRPVGGYRLILADPCWEFVTFGGKALVGGPAGGVQPYPTMSLPELKRLPVRSMAAKDAVLVMWIVDASLEAALELGRAWGFTYKTRAMTWAKGRMTGGYWFRRESEISLLFTRGSPTRMDAGVREMITARPREHSRKPDEQYGLCERLVRGPYLELFSRTDRPGWVSWGNEAGRWSAPREAKAG